MAESGPMNPADDPELPELRFVRESGSALESTAPDFDVDEAAGRLRAAAVQRGLLPAAGPLSVNVTDYGAQLEATAPELDIAAQEERLREAAESLGLLRARERRPVPDERWTAVMMDATQRGPRSALVIATSAYADPRLRELHAPVGDTGDFADVLADPEIGGFTVGRLVDERTARIRLGLEDFLHGREPDETVLVYLSGHGLLDKPGALFFAAGDTDTALPHATAISATELTDLLDNCRARHQVLILDCCFSGLSAASKSSEQEEGPLPRQLLGHGTGRDVLSVICAVEHASADETLDSEAGKSVFTASLTKGLRTGDADSDRDGLITVTDAYSYALRQVLQADAQQTPQPWLSLHGSGQTVLARSPARRTVMSVTLTGESFLARRAWLRERRRGQDVVSSVLQGHVGAVTSLAFSPDGRMLASAGNDGTILLWNPETGERSQVLHGHEGRVTGVAFSPDGGRLASSGRDQTVRLWDLGTGTQAQIIQEQSDVVHAALISTDETMVVYDGEGGLLAWVNSSERKPLSLRQIGEDAQSVAFNSDGVLVAPAGRERTIMLWDTASRWPSRLRDGHRGRVRKVALSPDGALLASCGDDATVRLWDAATGEQTTVLGGHSGTVLSVAFGVGSALIASAGSDNTVRVWDARTGELLRVLEGHTAGVYDVTFSPDGDLLASAGEDATIRVWR